MNEPATIHCQFFAFIWLKQKTTNIILICIGAGDDEIQSFQQHLNRIAAEKLLLEWATTGNIE